MNPPFAVYENPSPELSAPSGLDPKLTEQFLLSQPDVFDASVWYSNGRMHASVTLSESATWTPSGLKKACYERLGIRQTPNEILMLSAKLRAA